MAVDQLAGKYPTLSPYGFVGNTPIIAVDKDGKKITFGFLSSEDNINLFTTMLKAEFHGKVKVEVVNGFLEIHKKENVDFTDREDELYFYLNMIIQDATAVDSTHYVKLQQKGSNIGTIQE